jgi:hypothetical protein
LQHNATKSLCGHLLLPGAVGITANCSEAQEIINTLQRSYIAILVLMTESAGLRPTPVLCSPVLFFQFECFLNSNSEKGAVRGPQQLFQYLFCRFKSMYCRNLLA